MAMILGVRRETVPGETRVALVPSALKPLLKSGFEVVVEPGAGAAAGYPDTAFTEAGARLGMTEDAVKMAVYRLRKRYRDLLRAQIAATVSRNAEIDLEIRDLFRVLASPR